MKISRTRNSKTIKQQPARLSMPSTSSGCSRSPTGWLHHRLGSDAALASTPAVSPAIHEWWCEASEEALNHHHTCSLNTYKWNCRQTWQYPMSMASEVNENKSREIKQHKPHVCGSFSTTRGQARPRHPPVQTCGHAERLDMQSDTALLIQRLLLWQFHISPLKFLIYSRFMQNSCIFLSNLCRTQHMISCCLLL